ncbi:hypothetical protein SAMN03159367_04336, partial [Pseudomonas sp. NFACC06-1]
FKAIALNADECYRYGGWAWNTGVADAAQTLEKLWRDLSTRCEQRYIKRRRHWNRFVGIPQGLSPFPHAETDKRLKAPLEPLWLKAGWTIERIEVDTPKYKAELKINEARISDVL